MSLPDLALALVGLLAACGGDDSFSVEDYQIDLFSATCRVQARCGRASADSCDAPAVLFDLGLEAQQAAVDDGRVLVDTEAAELCLAEIETLPCTPLFDGELALEELPTSCAGVFLPVLKEGDVCYLTGPQRQPLIYECDGPAFCERDPACGDESCCAGTCGMAFATREPGQSCERGDCKYPAVCADGTCKVPAAEGDPCNSLCPPGLFCGGRFTCDRYPAEDGTEGEACGGDAPCAPGLFCDSTPDLEGRECTVRGDIGDPCDPGCLPYLACIDGVCSDKPGPGQLCEFRSGCRGSVCIDSFCVVPADDGEPCTSPAGCRSGICQGSAIAMTCRPRSVCLPD